MFPELPNFITALRSYPWWQVGIELLIIGTVVYWALKLLQGTRGARMLKGQGFVLVTLYLIVRLVGRRFGLERVEFLYSKFLLFTSFAMVIVFQPELRRALLRLGEANLFRSATSKIEHEINALVDAAQWLSRRKCGALIAIERDSSLGSIAENGTHLDAEITPELLQTIFFPDSPLHDLGVVVSGGRIAYAAVQFPLAEAGELERELGSRHRAAVGLSQDSDALVLVVSEESGDISIAERGQLYRKLSPEGLRDLLGGMLGLEADLANSRRTLFPRPFPIPFPQFRRAKAKLPTPR